MASDATARAGAHDPALADRAPKPPADGNAYVGPQPFPPGRVLYGRDRELLALSNRLLSERLLLLYSPSGAGKTSLIQARGGLRDRMAAEGFRPMPVARVGRAAGLAAESRVNRYLLSLLIDLEAARPEAGRRPAEALASLLRPDAGGPLGPSFLSDHLVDLESEPGPDGAIDEGPAQGLLVLDQFEEVLTLDPTDEAEKREFMRQLGTALKDEDRWALFAMREDYLAALETYLPLVPTRLSATFRLYLLGRDAAAEAIRRPAAGLGVTIGDETVAALIGDLARIQVMSPIDGRLRWKDGPHVEPVHLQVVCESLWRFRGAPDRITPDDIKRLSTGGLIPKSGDHKCAVG